MVAWGFATEVAATTAHGPPSRTSTATTARTRAFAHSALSTAVGLSTTSPGTGGVADVSGVLERRWDDGGARGAGDRGGGDRAHLGHTAARGGVARAHPRGRAAPAHHLGGGGGDVVPVPRGARGAGEG